MKKIAIVGTGLTAMDALQSLRERGFAGQVLMLSRHGLLPREHAPTSETARADWIDRISRARGPLEAFRAFRAEAARVDWRPLIDGLRSHVPKLWKAWGPTERARFLRHLRPYWEIHRHRMPVSLKALIDERVEIIAARALRFEDKVVHFNDRDGMPRAEKVDAVIACTGLEFDVNRIRMPLLQSLLRKEYIVADPLGLGFTVSPHVRGLSALGPLQRGLTWELTAVPELRQEAAARARALAESARYLDRTYGSELPRNPDARVPH